MSTEINWAEIGPRLSEPFDPAVVEFLPGAGVQDDGTAYVMAYVDARAVQERLDTVLGPGGWGFTWEPITLDKDLRVVRGSITIGGVTKQDVGTASDTEPSKGAVSDAFKRTAVLWGPGRYLYSLDNFKVTMTNKGVKNGKTIWRLSSQELTRLRGRLPRPGTAPPPLVAPVAAEDEPDTPPAAEEFAALQPARPRTVAAAPTPIRAVAGGKPQEGTSSAEQRATIQRGFVALKFSSADQQQYLGEFNVNYVSELSVEQAVETIKDLARRVRGKAAPA